MTDAQDPEWDLARIEYTGEDNSKESDPTQFVDDDAPENAKGDGK